MIKTMLAIGGNAFQPVAINKNSVADIQAQIDALSRIARQFVKVIYDSNIVATGDKRNMVLTHGNGPQVGILMRRSELSKHPVAQGGVGYPVPLDILDADTQGSIGYMLFVAYWDAISELGYAPEDFPKLATVITPVRVETNDPAFDKPLKPVGIGYTTEREAKEAMTKEGWAGYIFYEQTKRWRRVVPSPFPAQIESIEAIQTLFESGKFLLVCVGGGGIPYSIDPEKAVKTEAAVIDKDIASARCAVELGIDEFIICTSVKHLKLDYCKPTERDVLSLCTSDLEKWLEEDKLKTPDDKQFKTGQMEPKLEAILYFLKNSPSPDARAIITNVDMVYEAIMRKTNCTLFANNIKTIIIDKSESTNT